MTEEDLPGNTMFQGHVTKFMQLVDVIVENLDVQKDEVEKILLMLGAKHATYNGFKDDYFQVYTKCMLEVWESVIGEEFIPEVKESWLAVFSYITRYMREGYALYVQEQSECSVTETNQKYSSRNNHELHIQT